MYERRRRRIRDGQVLPEEIFFKILERLPVKSLLQCGCVCQSRKTLIRSPDFISAHLETSVMKKACDYLLIETSKRDCFSICCAETFSKCLDVKVPLSHFYAVIGSCNGLLCMSDFISIYLWNPSIRKIKRLPIGVIQDTTYVVAIGFGFHRSKNDYKVVRVMRFERKEFEVEVYSLRLNSWRKISVVPPDVSVSEDKCVFLNGVVYWSTREPFQGSTFILSFDFGSEEFRRIMLPHEVRIMLHHVRTSFRHIHIRVFKKSFPSSIDEDKMGNRVGFMTYGFLKWILRKSQISYGYDRYFFERSIFGFI